jgi:hypothetical protein
LEYTWGYIKEFNYVASSNGIKYPYKIKNTKKKNGEEGDISLKLKLSQSLSVVQKWQPAPRAHFIFVS